MKNNKKKFNLQIEICILAFVLIIISSYTMVRSAPFNKNKTNKDQELIIKKISTYSLNSSKKSSVF